MSSGKLPKGALQVFMNESQVKPQDMANFARNDDSIVDGTRPMSVLAMARQYEELHCLSRRPERLPFARRITNLHGGRQSQNTHFTMRRHSAESECESKRLRQSSTHSQLVSVGQEPAVSCKLSDSNMVTAADHVRTSEPQSPERLTVCPWNQTHDPLHSASEPLLTEPALEAPSTQSSYLSRSPDEVTEAPSYSTYEPLFTELAVEAPSTATSISQLPEQVNEATSIQTLESQMPEESIEAPSRQSPGPLEISTEKLDEKAVAPSHQTSEDMIFETAAAITDAGKLDTNQGDVTPVKRSLTKRLRLWLKNLSRRSRRTSKRGLTKSELQKTTEISSSHCRSHTTASQVAVKETDSAALHNSDQRMSGIEELVSDYEDVSQIPLPPGTPPASSVRRMSVIEEGVWTHEGHAGQTPLYSGTPPEPSHGSITGIEDRVLADDAEIVSASPLPQQVFVPRRPISEFIAQRATELLLNGWTPGTPLDKKVKLTRPTPSWLDNERLQPPSD